MRYLRTDGKELRRYQWKCGQCKNDIIPNLVQIEGGPLFPFDIPISCPNCAVLVAMFNPLPPPEIEPESEAGARSAEGSEDGRAVDALTDQDGRLHADVAASTSALAEPTILEDAIAPPPEPPTEPTKPAKKHKFF